MKIPFFKQCMLRYKKHISTHSLSISIRQKRRLTLPWRSKRLCKLMISCIFMVLMTTACTSNTVKSIEFDQNIVIMELSQEVSLPFYLTPEDASTDSLEVQADKGISAEIKDQKLVIHTKDKEGNFKITISNKNTSATVTVYAHAKANHDAL